MFNKLIFSSRSAVYKLLALAGVKNNKKILGYMKDYYRLIEYFYLYLRSLKPMVKLFGYSYEPSREMAEVDITYRCNLACNNCNRSLGDGQAKSKAGMSLEQFDKFLDESVASNHQWKIIKILGGEPTMHPQFFEIIESVKNYKKNHNKTVEIQLWTNGCGQKVESILEQLDDDIVVINSSKQKGDEQVFNAFNLAPIDSGLYRFSDFSNGCSITEKCGIGVTPYGYYPCAVAGSIDRVMGKDVGTKELDNAYGNMREQLNDLCRYCGHFRISRSVTEVKKSKVWEIAYVDYKKSKPKISEY